METLTQRFTEVLKQNKYLLVIVLIGILLMLIPTGREKNTQNPPQAQTEPSEDLESRLEDILGRIQGVGRVQVLLTIAEGERIQYEYNQDNSESSSGSDQRTDVVIITDSSRGEAGLVRQVVGPVFQGAVIVCQGGDIPSVRLAVVEAVANATGLSSNQISVLKMK